MQVFFKMIIDDGEKYYAGEDPGVAICDYVYMRGLNGILVKSGQILVL